MSIIPDAATTPPANAVPLPVLVVFRGIGQVFFQDHALTGALFVLGIALASPIMAAGLLAGAVIGTAVAWVCKFDRDELHAGIYGFNPALVGIATLFFFQPSATSIALMIAGAAAAAFLTRLMRGAVPFPTYTTPFILITWCIYLIGKSIGLATVTEYPLLIANPATSWFVESIAHGVGQVMFQASILTGVLFVIGIAISNNRHAGLVLLGSVIGALLASYHVDATHRAIDPEKIIERDLFENIRLGLYGYNAALASVALYLWRRSLIPSLLGAIVTVPMTEFFPKTGLPALTAPFVLATWLVMAVAWLDARMTAPESNTG